MAQWETIDVKLVRGAWKILVGIKDGLVLVFMLLFFGILFAALSAKPNSTVRDGALLLKLDEDAVKASTAVGTIGMLLNAGPFHKELTRLSREEVVPLFGSSANLTGTGTRFSVEEIPDELKRIADITIDYGLRRYHTYRRAGTLINFDTLQVVRIGACYELISGVLRRWFGLELPPDPGFEQLPSGHLNEFGLKGVE